MRMRSDGDSCGAGIIGVNNRDLRTFTVDIMNSVRLRKLIPDMVPATHMGTEVPVTGTGAAADTLAPKKTVYVSESGIKAKEDIDRLKANGTDAVLIGETFMRSPDKKELFAELRGE